MRHTKKSLELEPSRALAWQNLGSIYHDLARKARREGTLQKAVLLAKEGIQSLEKSILLKSTDPFAFGNLGSCYKELGLALELQGKEKEAFEARSKAVQTYQQALSMRSDNELFPVLWFNLGMVFVEAGYHSHAPHYLKNFLQAYPDYRNLPFSRVSWIQAQYWMGVSYFRQKKYAESIPHLEKFCQLEPQLDTWGMLAKSYEELGENRKGIATYLKVLAQFPDSVETHYNLAVLYHRVGEFPRAVEHLERALHLSPEGPLVSEIRTMLEAIRRDVPKS